MIRMFFVEEDNSSEKSD